MFQITIIIQLWPLWFLARSFTIQQQVTKVKNVQIIKCFNNLRTFCLAPSVNVLAPNRIEYSNITLGVVDALCIANKTSSDSITIPFLKNLVYSHQPENPYLGYTFEPHCNLEIFPIPSKYSILFQKDDNITGNWTVDGSVFIWSMPSKVFDLQVTSGSSQYPTFTTRQMASSTTADGDYTCSLFYSSARFIYTYSASGVRVAFLKVGTSTTSGNKKNTTIFTKI